MLSESCFFLKRNKTEKPLGQTTKQGGREHQLTRTGQGRNARDTCELRKLKRPL